MNAVPESPCEEGEHDDEEKDESYCRCGGHGRHHRLGLPLGRRAASPSPSSLHAAAAATAAAVVPVSFDYLVERAHGGGLTTG